MQLTRILPLPETGKKITEPPSTDDQSTAEASIPPEFRYRRVALGEEVGTSVFTAENILEMRGRVGAGESQRHVAMEFGTSPTHLSRVIQRKAWSWLPHREPTPAERAKADAYKIAMKNRKPGRSVREAMQHG